LAVGWLAIYCRTRMVFPRAARAGGVAEILAWFSPIRAQARALAGV
jgi:hypothetical protein